MPNSQRRVRAGLLAFIFGNWFALPAIAGPVTKAPPAPPAMNLGSMQTNVTAPNTHPVSIRVGDSSGRSGVMNVAPGQALTPAELLAVTQLMTTGRQTLMLNTSGAATGGSAVVSAASALNSLSALSIPKGVSILSVGTTGANALTVTGAVNLAGSLFALQRAAGLDSFLDFGSLNVAGTGLLSGAPASGKLAGFFPSRNLTVEVHRDFVNAGVISNDAGGLKIVSDSGSIRNSGLIQAAENVALVSQGASSFNIDSTGGTVRSANGSILVSSAGTSLPTDVLVSGGNWSATKGGINVDAGCGNIAMNANRLDGPVNLVAANAVAGATNGDVRIASSKLSADPIFFAAGGDLDLSGIGFAGAGSTTTEPDGNVYRVYSTGGSNFVALASGSITCTSCTGANFLVDATNYPANGGYSTGGSITLAAGVNFSIGSGTTYNLLGPSTTGGSINLPNVGFRTNGASISIQTNSPTSALGNIAILNAESSGAGGLGASRTGNSGQVGQAGQSAGNITIEANAPAATVTIGTGNGYNGYLGTNGTSGATTTPSSSDTGFLRAYGGGGGGGLDLLPVPTGTGGAGGNGGNITVVASGNIAINGDINSSGGGAGANDSTTTAKGGAGGNVAVISGIGTLEIAGPVLAAGGGKGGNASPIQAGGASLGGGGGATNDNAGANGGGINGGGLGGSSSGSAYGGGGFFGGGGSSSGTAVQGALGLGGGPGTAIHFGESAFGTGGIEFSGTAGTINLIGTSVGVNKEVNTYGGYSGTGFSGSIYAHDSINNYGNSSGNIVIAEPWWSAYVTNLDLTSSTVFTSSTFTHSSPITGFVFNINSGTNLATNTNNNGSSASSTIPLANSGTYGFVHAGFADTINGNSLTNSADATTSDFWSGGSALSLGTAAAQGTFSIKEGSQSFAVKKSTPTLTAAEGVAVLTEIIYNSAQTLTLTGSGLGTGVASGGSFIFSPASLAGSPLSAFTLPSGVTANVIAPGLVSPTVTLNGTAAIAVKPQTDGAGFVATPALTINGSGSTVNTNISFNSSSKTPSSGAATYAGAITSGTASDLTITLTTGASSAGISASTTGGGGVYIGASPGASVIINQTGTGTTSLTVKGVSSSTSSKFASDTAITFDDGITLAGNNNVIVETPQINVGNNGPDGAISTLSATTSVTLQANSTQTGQLALSSVSAGASTLSLVSPSNKTVSDALTMDGATTLKSNGNLTISSINGDSLTFPALANNKFSTPTGTATVSSTNSIIIGNGASLAFDANAVFQAPTVTVGDGTNDNESATVTSVGTLTFQANGSQTGSFTFNSGSGVTGTLFANSTSTAVTADSFNLGTTTTLNQQDNNPVNIQSKAGDSLTFFADPTAAITTSGTLLIASNTSVNFVDGSNLAVTGGTTVVLQTPSLVIGTAGTGSQSATIQGAGGYTIQSNSAQTGTVTLSTFAGASDGTLSEQGGLQTNIVCDTFGITSNTTLANADSNIAIAPAGTGTLTILGTAQGTFSTPNGAVDLTSGTAVAFGNGAHLHTSNTLNIQSPSLIVGTSGTGAQTAQLDVGDSLHLTAQADSHGTLTISTVGTASSGTLTFNAVAADDATADSFVLGSNTTIANPQGGLTVQSAAATGLTFASSAGSAVTGGLRLLSDTSANIKNGTVLSLSNGLTIDSAVVTAGAAGDSGVVSATFTSTDGNSFAISPTNNNVIFNTIASATSGTLNFAGADVSVTTDQLTIASKTTLTANAGNMTISSNNNTLTISSATAGTIQTGAAFNTNIVSGNVLTFDKGSVLNITGGGSVAISAAQVKLGEPADLGALSATVQASGPISVRAAALALNIDSSNNSATGTLVLNGGAVTIAADSLGIGYNTTNGANITSDNSVTIQPISADLVAGIVSKITAPSTTIQSAGSVTFNGGSNVNATGSLAVLTPNIVVGNVAFDSGATNVHFSATGTTLTDYAGTNGTVSITTVPGAGNTGTLTIDGDTTVTTTQFSVASNVTVNESNAFTVTSDPSNSLTIASSAQGKVLSLASTFESTNSIHFANGSNLFVSANTPVNFLSPQIFVGQSGDNNPSASLGSGAAVFFAPSVAHTGTILFANAGSGTALLAVTPSNGIPGVQVYGDTVSVKSGFTLRNVTDSIRVAAPNNDGLLIQSTNSGFFSTPNGSTSLQSDTSVTFQNGAQVTGDKSVVVQAPQIVVSDGGGGTQTAHITSQAGQVFLQGVGGTGAVTVTSANGVTGILDLSSASGSFLQGPHVTIGGTTKLSSLAGGALTISPISGALILTSNGATVSGGAQISAPNGVSLSNGTTLNVTGGLNIVTPSIVVGAAGDGTGALSATLNGDTINVSQTGGTVAATTLSGASSGVLNLTGGNAVVGAKNFTLGGNTTLAVDHAITIDLTGGTFTNNGTFSTSVASGTQFTIDSTSNLTIAGVGSFNSNSNVTTQFSALSGTMAFANGANQTLSGTAQVVSPTVQGGATGDSLTNPLTATVTAQQILVQANGTSTGTVTLQPLTGTSGAVTLNLIGGLAPVVTAQNITLAGSNFTLSAGTGAIFFNANGGTFTNNATIHATQNIGAVIIVASTSGLTLAGNGNYVATATSNLDVAATGGVVLANGFVANVAGRFELESPSITIGLSGTDSSSAALSATINSSAATAAPNLSNIGTMQLQYMGGTGSGTVSFNGAPLTIAADGVAVGAAATVASDHAITVDSTSHILTVGNFSGTLSPTGPVTFKSTTAVNVANGTNLNLGNTPVILQSPVIAVGAAGDTGAVAATISGAGGISLQAQADQKGSLSLAYGGAANAGALTLNGSAVNVVANSINVSSDIASNKPITLQSVSGQSLTVSGTGHISGSGTTTITSGNAVSFANGTNLSVAGPVLVQSPSVVAGAVTDGTGDLVATVNGSGGIAVQANSGGTGTLAVTKPASANSGTLNLNGAPVTVTADTFSIGAGAKLASDHTITIQSTAADTLTIGPGTGTVSGTSATLSSKNAISFSGSNLQFGSGVSVQTPDVVVSGNSGITATGPVSIAPNAAGTGALAVTNSGSAATFTVSAPSSVSVTADTFSIAGSTTLADSNGVSIQATGGGALTISGSTQGTLDGGAGGTTFQSTSSVALANGASVNTTGDLKVVTPSVVVGNGVGAQSASLHSTGQILIEAQPNGSGSLSVSTAGAGTSGTLNLASTTGSVINADTFTLASNTTVTGTAPGPATPVTVQANAGHSLTVSSSGGSFNGQTNFVSDTAVILPNGTNVNVSGSSAVHSPVLQIGSYSEVGTVSATIHSTDGTALTVQPGSTTTGSLSVQAGPSASSASLHVTNGPLVLAGDNVSIAPSTSVTSDATVTVTSASFTVSNGATVNGTGSVNITSPSVTNNGSVTSNSAISVTSPSVTIAGTGSFTAGTSLSQPPSDGAVSILAQTGNLNLNGHNSISAANITIAAPAGNIDISSGTLSVSGITGLIVGNNFVGNPASITPTAGSPAPTMSLIGSATGAGMIVSPTGDVTLTKGMLINTNGKNLLIMAKGSVVETGVTTIDLSSGKGNGGNLSVFAGFAFVPLAANPNVYTVSGASTGGGAINLPGVMIKTSSTAPIAGGTDNAGSILMVANAGTGSAGLIAVGAISASSTNGKGGNISIYGEGGVTVSGAITSAGAGTGGNVTIAGAPVGRNGASFLAINASTAPANPFAGISLVPISGSGAAVSVNGAITTTSKTGSGGFVKLNGESSLTVASTINTSGVSGGAVSMTSLNGALKTGAITTSATARAASSLTGSAGDISLAAGALLTTGSLQAHGAANTLAGGAGAGGDVTLSTQSLDGGATHIGAITVTGFIDARGGDATTKLSGANNDGGAGGDVSITAGTFVVTGKTGTASVITSAGIEGTGGTHPGSSGMISLSSYAVQSFPFALDLTSKTANIFALPGGATSVGVASPVNGVAGLLVSGSSVSPVATYTVSPTTLPPRLSVAIGGPAPSQTLMFTDNSSLNVSPLLNGKRMSVNPSEALALFSLTHGGSQGIALAPVSRIGAAQGGSIAVDSRNIGAVSFTAFKLPGNVSLDFTGLRPVLNLPASTLLAGNINFNTAANDTKNAVSYINFGAGSPILTGHVTADPTGVLVLAGTGGTWTNKGAILANALVIERPTAAPLTFITGDNADISGYAGATGLLLSPTVDNAMNISFKSGVAHSVALQVNFATFNAPTLYAPQTSTALPAVNLSFLTYDGVAEPATVGGTVNASSITITGLSGTVGTGAQKTNVATPVQVLTSSAFSATKSISIVSAAASVNIGSLTRLTSGLFDGASTATTVKATDITSIGTLTLSSGTGGIGLGNGLHLTNNGSLLKITATSTTSSPNISFGFSDVLTNIGGNITVLAKGTVSGGNSGNSFTAIGVTGAASGGVEIGSGTTLSTLAAAFSKPHGTKSNSILGSPTINNGVAHTVGVILVNPASNAGPVTLTGGTLTVNNAPSGVIVFDALGGASSVSLPGTTIVSQSSKPISSASFCEQDDFVIDTAQEDDDALALKGI